jgi:hypothetical protein
MGPSAGTSGNPAQSGGVPNNPSGVHPSAMVPSTGTEAYGSTYSGTIDGLDAKAILGQALNKIKIEKFAGAHRIHGGIHWYDWSYQFQLNVSLVHIWKLFNGHIRAPPRGINPVWETEFNQLSLMGFNVLNKNVATHIQHALRQFSTESEPAMNAWKYLVRTFQSKDSSNQVALQDELSNFTMESGERAEDYLNRAIMLRDRLTMIGLPISDEMFCVHLLRGLTSDWHHFRLYFQFQSGLTKEALTDALLIEQRNRDNDVRRYEQAAHQKYIHGSFAAMTDKPKLHPRNAYIKRTTQPPVRKFNQPRRGYNPCCCGTSFMP